MLYVSDIWPDKDDCMIRPDKNDQVMVTWICNVTSEDRIFAEECRTKLKCNCMGGMFTGKSLQLLVKNEQNGRQCLV